MKLNLSFSFTLLFIYSLSAQIEIKDLNNRSLLKKNKSLLLRTPTKNVYLKNYSYEEYGNDFLLESEPGGADSISYSIVNREGVISGFVYYPLQEKSILIKTIKGITVYEETASSDVLVSCSFDEQEVKENEMEIAHEQVYPDTYFIGNYSSETDVLKLQSKPGAKYLIYLDFDGEPYLKGWENQGFVATAVTNIPNGLKQRIWEAVAADFIAFDVNVTNDRSLFDAHSTTRKGWAVCADFGSPGWYGVAFRPSFGTGKPALIDLPTSWNGNYNYLFRTPSHELGHSLSLSHDGNNLNGDGEYYKGHGEYTPIMGSGNRLVTHWSKGEYSGATNKEDDIAIIHDYLGYADDDNQGVRALTFSSDKVNSIDNNGVIEDRYDEDVWSFEMTGTGDVSLTIDPVLALSDFDVKIELKNSAGQLISESNPVGDRKAFINQSLSRGVYYIHISSGNEGSANTGWSDYGVLGYYDIYGTVENVVREKVDIIALGINGLKEVCSESVVIQPEIEILNGGSELLSNVIIEVYEDGQLLYSLNKNIGLLSDETASIQLTDITNEGSHVYTVKLIDPNGIETKTDNNEKSGNYEYTNGNVYEFYTDMPFYSGESGFVWEITSAKSGGVIKSSNEVEVAFNNSNSIQNMCLATSDCFSFEFSGSIDNCTGNNRWDETQVYNSGDVCVYGGFEWKAKWWTQNEAPPASVWDKLGACSSANYEFGLLNVNSQLFEFENNTVNYSDPMIQEFCSGSITNTRGEDFELESFEFFPNPMNNELNIKVNGKGSIELFSTTGKRIINESISEVKTLDVSTLSKGTYLLVYTSKEGRYSRTVIK